jgi:hypothetical protein
VVTALLFALRYAPATDAPRAAMPYSRLLGSLVTLVRDEPLLRQRSLYAGLGFATFIIDAKGAANGTMTGPVRAPAKADALAVAERIVVLQGSDPANIGRAVLVSAL